ncbi:MAG: hypothetical protein AAF311_08470 [Pseudomonadota bacterium]
MSRQAAIVALILVGAALSLPDAGALELPASIAAIDQDNDRRVEFGEFEAFAAAQGVSSTQAAQHFTRISGDDAVLDPAELLYAVRVAESSTWMDGYDATALVTLWPDTVDGPAQGRILEITPNEEIAGEVTHAFESAWWEEDRADRGL